MSKVTDEIVLAFLNAHGGARDSLQALFDANLIALPVDRDRVREEVVRDAIALFEGNSGTFSAPYICVRLKSLLPTKDRPEALADAYWHDRPHTAEMYADTVDAFRWLIAREKV